MFFLLIIFLAFSAVTCFRDKTPEEIEDAISRSDSLKRVNKLCAEMPKPDDFKFIRKGLAGNTNTASVVLYYLSFEEPKKNKEFYRKWAKENGWQSDNLRYYKGNQTVFLEFQPMKDWNLAISCQEPR